MDELGDYIARKSGATTGIAIRLGELMLETTPDKLIALLTFLKTDPRCLFAELMDVFTQGAVVRQEIGGAAGFHQWLR